MQIGFCILFELNEIGLKLACSQSFGNVETLIYFHCLIFINEAGAYLLC
jgi:hypothetical protein